MEIHSVFPAGSSRPGRTRTTVQVVGARARAVSNSTADSIERETNVVEASRHLQVREGQM